MYEPAVYNNLGALEDIFVKCYIQIMGMLLQLLKYQKMICALLIFDSWTSSDKINFVLK